MLEFPVDSVSEPQASLYLLIQAEFGMASLTMSLKVERSSNVWGRGQVPYPNLTPLTTAAFTHYQGRRIFNPHYHY